MRSEAKEERLAAVIMSDAEYHSEHKLPVCRLDIIPETVLSLLIKTCARGRDFWMGQAKSEMAEGMDGAVPLQNAMRYADTITRIVYSSGYPDMQKELEDLSQFYREVEQIQKEV